MKVETLKNKIESLCENMGDLINVNMQDSGLTCEKSQKVCLLNALSSFEQAVAGIDASDMQEQSDD